MAKRKNKTGASKKDAAPISSSNIDKELERTFNFWIGEAGSSSATNPQEAEEAVARLYAEVAKSGRYRRGPHKAPEIVFCQSPLQLLLLHSLHELQAEKRAPLAEVLNVLLQEPELPNSTSVDFLSTDVVFAGKSLYDNFRYFLSDCSWEEPVGVDDHQLGQINRMQFDRLAPCVLDIAFANYLAIREFLGGIIDILCGDRIASQDKDMLSSCKVWLMGVQRSEPDWQADFLGIWEIAARVAGTIFKRNLIRQHHGRDWMSTTVSWLNVASALHMFVPYEKVCFVSQRPRTIKLNEHHRLHSEDGPALEYSDGYKIFAWNGVRMPAETIEQAASMTVDDIHNEINIHIRSSMIEIYGTDRYLLDSGARVVDSSNRGLLYRSSFAYSEDLVVLRVFDEQSDYWLRVPPDMESVQQAVAWTFHMDTDEYDPLVET